jgi:CDP-diglyceride synthetase
MSNREKVFWAAMTLAIDAVFLAMPPRSIWQPIAFVLGVIAADQIKYLYGRCFGSDSE